MDAREYMEWAAFQAMENAAAERQEQRRLYRRSNTATTASKPPRSKPLTKSTSCVDGALQGCTGCTVNEEALSEDVRNRIHISKSSTNFRNGVSMVTDDARPEGGTDSDRDGVMGHMRKRLSDNFEHYSNIFHGVALPMLFRNGRTRSRSRSRDKHDNRDQNSNRRHSGGVRDEEPLEEGYDIVEHIELRQMDSFACDTQPVSVIKEAGRGHHFMPVMLDLPSWCDKCGDFIWGVQKECLKCSYCEYTVHHKCRQGVTLDCVGGATNKDDDDDIQTETSLSGDTSQADDADSGYHTGSSTLQSRGPKGTRKPPGEWTLTREDLRRGIETFNNNNHGLIMSLQSDTNTFQGFIRVHMNLIRPINMSLSTRPTSIYDVIGQGDEEEEEFNDGKDATQITSFYLPKDTTKVIHINSDTTTQEVIKALLSKFKITDNPRKFALYEKVLESEKKASMRRMEEDECPLPLCLCWTSDGLDGLDRRKFVLQENDTGEIMWEAFSLPELENFLRILNREEEEYVEQVKAKYRMLKIHMERRLKEINETRAKEDGKRRPVFV